MAFSTVGSLGTAGSAGLAAQKLLAGNMGLQQLRPQRRRLPGPSRQQVAAFFGGSASKNQSPEPVVSEKLALLLNYVQEVEPGIVDHFQDVAPAQVLDAMTQTVSNMVGTLPPAFFSVKVSAHGENLAQLLFSATMTGYLFRSAQYRLELTQSLALPAGSASGGAAGDDASGSSFLPHDTTEFAPGTQKSRVSGDVIRWNNAKGPEAIPASAYIESLERELHALRRQLAQHKALAARLAAEPPAARNALLEYLRSLDPVALEELTACADDDSAEAVNALIHRVLGTSTHQELRRVTSESDAEELSHLLYYLMAVGYLLRTLEVRFYLDGSGNGADADAPAGGPGGKGPGGNGVWGWGL